MLTVGDKNIIVDCGMEQGPDYYVNQQIPVKPSDIDAILVTHAHIDHTGLIPLLVKNGFKGPIYSTAATAQLCKIMLQDSAHIQEFEAEWKNRKARRAGNPEVEPMYTVQDALDAAELFIPCAYSTKVDVCAGIQARFTDVGHLLGSACIEVWATEGNTTKKVLFSGDVGNTDQPILKDPQTVDEADYVLIESTYGDREHEAEKPDYVGDFTAILRDTFLRGGNVVVPSFAVGRTQELLYFIRQIKEEQMNCCISFVRSRPKAFCRSFRTLKCMLTALWPTVRRMSLRKMRVTALMKMRWRLLPRVSTPSCCRVLR